MTQHLKTTGYSLLTNVQIHPNKLATKAEQREVEVNNEDALVPSIGVIDISLNEENQMM